MKKNIYIHISKCTIASLSNQNIFVKKKLNFKFIWSEEKLEI